jgi:hypothetical protein
VLMIWEQLEYFYNFIFVLLNFNVFSNLKILN